MTASLEEYLKTIYVLYNKNGVARVTDIALEMNCSKSSVNRALKVLKEEEKQYVLTFDEDFSAHCDGIKLFETMNDINRAISLTLKKQKIIITIPKKKNKDLLMETLKNIEEKFLWD